MPERFTLEQLKSRPVTGTWSLEGGTEEYPGFLHLEEDELNLTLYFNVRGHRFSGRPRQN